MYDFETLHPRVGMGSEKWDSVNQEGDEVIVPLSVADMEFRTAPPVIDAVREMADFGLWGYTHEEDSFRQSVKDWMARRHGWEIDENWIVTTPGVVPALFTAVRAYTSPGDKIIIQTPVYPPFYSAVENNGRKLVENELNFQDVKYRMDLEDLASKAKDAKMLILCSPHNPVGRVWSREELLHMAEICQENGLIVVSDEIHCDIIMPPNRHIPYGTLPQALRKNCVIATSASKSFSLAGLSCSSILIEDVAMRKKFNKQQFIDGTYFNSTFGWVATRAAYNHGEPWLDELVEVIAGNYAYVAGYLEENIPCIKAYPMEGTYLAWIDCRKIRKNATELEKLLVEKARLYVNQGITFGAAGDGFIRMNLACPRKVLESALYRLKGAAAIE